MNKKFAVLAGGLLIAGLWLVRWQRQAEPETRPLGCHFKAGDKLGFTYDARIGATVNASAAMGGDGAPPGRPILASLSMNMAWKILRAEEGSDEGEWLAAVAFSNLKVETAAQSGDAKALTAEMTEPFLIRINDRCRFTGFGFSKSQSLEAQNRLQMQLQSVEVVFPKDADTAWIASQWDNMGEYRAQYKIDRAHPNGFFRERLNMVRLHKSQGFLAKDVRFAESNAHFSLDGDGRWLSDFESHLATDVNVGDRPFLSAHSHLKLARTNADDKRLDGAFEENHFAWVAPDAPPRTAPARDGVDAQTAATLATMPADVLLDRALTLFARGHKDEFRELLVLYLRARPQAAGALMELLLAGKIPPEARPDFFRAVGTSGTPEAQDALMEVMRTPRFEKGDRDRAVVAITQVKAVTDKALKTLVEFADHSDEKDLRATARLMTGAVEHEAPADQSARRAELNGVLKRWVGESSSVSDYHVALAAVGNAGDATLIETVKPLLGDASPYNRASALLALRRMPVHETSGLLAPGFADESSAVVDQAARVGLEQSINARGLPDLSVLEAAAARLSREPDSHTRGALINLLGPAAKTVDLAKRALIDQFHREKAAELLELIGRYVAASELG